VRRWGGVGWWWHADALLRIDEGAQPVDFGLLRLVRLPLLRELVPGLVELAALGLSLARHVLVHEPQVGELSELRSPRSELSSLPRDLSSPPHDLSSLSGELSSHGREPPRRIRLQTRVGYPTPPECTTHTQHNTQHTQHTQHNTQHNTTHTQHNTVQHNTTQHNATQHNTAHTQHNTTHSTTQTQHTHHATQHTRSMHPRTRTLTRNTTHKLIGARPRGRNGRADR